jgi:antitoxin Phd
MTKSRAMRRGWPLAEAKAHLSELVERASESGPQQITRHGKPAAVLVSIADWRKLEASRKPLVAFLREGLAGLDVGRPDDAGRDVEL